MTWTQPLITAPELAACLAGERPPVLMDVRWVLGADSQHDQYRAGHIPGARWVEFEEVVTGPVQPGGDGGRHPMPEPAVFQEQMRRLGLDDDDEVVVYDAANSLAASRLWFVLRAFGHDRVRVLDGGLGAWTQAGGALQTEPPEVTPGSFVAQPVDAVVIDAAGAAALAEGGRLYDARAADRFAGDNETIDPVAGHIPGARNLFALDNVGPDGRFLGAPALRDRFAAAGIEDGEAMATYCGSGVQACHLALAIAAAGMEPELSVYVGSWSDWISDPSRPVSPR